MLKKVIDELTEENKAAMPRYVAKWTKIGTNTDRLDYDRAADIVDAVRAEILQRPKAPLMIVDNPLEAWIACNYFHYHKVPVAQLPGKVKAFFEGKDKISLENFSMPHLTGSFDASIFAFYDYFRTELKVDFGEHDQKYQIWQSTSELGLIFPFNGITIVSQKPNIIRINDQVEPAVAHCDGDVAIGYTGMGGFDIHLLNGVRVPEWLAVTHSSKIDVKRYHEISNADARMEFVKKLGIERMLSMGRKIDTYKNYNKNWWTLSEYELYDMAKLFTSAPFAPHLKMLNQTTGVWHVEPVSPACTTLEDAIRERLGGDFDLQGIA